MQAIDVMTRKVITVTPETSVEDIARKLLKHHISAVPVVDDKGAVLGLVSEGDLIRRIVDDKAPRRSWWLELLSGTGARAADYVKTHGRHARDVMTRDVVTIAQDMELGAIARLLEKKRIKRVPVVHEGKLVGIVSRSNLLQGLGSSKKTAAAPASDDRVLREKILEALSEVPGVGVSLVNVIVEDGRARVWGVVDSDFEEKAIRVAVENVEGVREVELQMGRIPAWSYGI